ncbi:MAG: SurA N-terminal domain-containing protein [Steroidobacteraceae bacterium]
MLQKIRDKVSGWVASLFLGTVAIVFVFWGIDFQSNASAYAAKVDGEKIPVETVRKAWQQRMTQLQQMVQGEVPPELLKAQKSAMLDQFVRQNLLTQRAVKNGYHVTDEALAARVMEIPQFQADGKFSADRYHALIAQAGLSTAKFEADLKTELLVTQVQSAVIDSAFTTPYDLERRYRLEKQERELDYALIAASSFADQIKLTDEQVQAWYDGHKSEYLTAETVDLEYVELTRASTEGGVTVTEQALKDYYAQVKERFESPERRKARHVLITATDGVDDAAAQKKAQEVLDKAKGGADFAQLAKDNSKDPGSAAQGGDLGWAQRGMFVGPFEDALFAMQPGEIRGPIKTQFGYHVIRLDEVEKGKLRTFEEARPDLEAEYRKERSETLFYDESQKLADQSFSSLTTLAPVSKNLKLPLHTIKGFTRQGGGELGAEPAVIEAAFSEDVVERRQNSPLLAIGQDKAVILRVTDHKPAEAKPLADVRAQIETQLRAKLTRDAAAKKGAEIVTRLQQGGAWSTLAGDNLTSVGKRYVNRQDAIAPPAVVRETFAVPVNKIAEAKPYYAGVVTDDGNYAIFAVTAVRAGDPKRESEADLSARRLQSERELGNEEFAAYIAEAEAKADIVRNEAVFD